MKLEKSYGGIILHNGKILLGYHGKRKIWGFPKGKKKGLEFGLNCAKREIYEETGVIGLKYIKRLGSYKRDTKKKGYVRKKITLYLFKTDKKEICSHDKKNPKAKWVDVDKVEKKLYYELDKKFFNKIKVKLMQKESL